MGKRISDSTVFFMDLESRAQTQPVQALRLNGKANRISGLLIFENGMTGPEVDQAIAKLKLSSKSSAGSAVSDAPDPAAQPHDADDIQHLLSVELDRVQRSRLPCTLLLLSITIPGKNAAKEESALMRQAVAALSPALHQIDILAPLPENRFALILPGTNLGKGLKRAEEIRTGLQTANFHNGTKPLRPALAAGVAVCHAYDRLTAAELLNLAKEELLRAENEGNDTICHATASRLEDSCQVTVEERAQLFSFLHN